MKDTKDEIIQKLRAREWTMGNGQCDCCCGKKEGFNGHIPTYNKFEMGHKKGCVDAMMLEYLGEEVLYKKPSKTKTHTCGLCGNDLTVEGSRVNSWNCAKCGADLLFHQAKTYEEVF